jgi:hypothetical protein
MSSLGIGSSLECDVRPDVTDVWLGAPSWEDPVSLPKVKGSQKRSLLNVSGGGSSEEVRSVSGFTDPISQPLSGLTLERSYDLDRGSWRMLAGGFETRKPIINLWK